MGRILCCLKVSKLWELINLCMLSIVMLPSLVSYSNREAIFTSSPITAEPVKTTYTG